jgi:hypothetical protein
MKNSKTSLTNPSLITELAKKLVRYEIIFSRRYDHRRK